MLILLFPIVNNVIKVSREDCSLSVFFKCLCLFFFVFVVVFVFLLVSQVMSPHHSDQMSQRSKVSGVAIWGCSPNVFIIVIVFVFVFVIVIVFLFVRSCLLITLITCLKGHKSLRVLFGSVFQQWRSQWVSEWVTSEPIELSGDS